MGRSSTQLRSRESTMSMQTSFLLTMMLKRFLIALLTGAGNSQVAISLYDDLSVYHEQNIPSSITRSFLLQLRAKAAFIAVRFSKRCDTACPPPLVLDLRRETSFWYYDLLCHIRQALRARGSGTHVGKCYCNYHGLISVVGSIDAISPCPAIACLQALNDIASTFIWSPNPSRGSSPR